MQLVLLCGAATLSLYPTEQRNVTIVRNANNVKGEVGQPSVKLLGVVANISRCEDLCYAQSAPACLSFTYHHLDFVKVQYQGHCYGHTDAAWAPQSQNQIDSGCRRDIVGALGSRCTSTPLPPGPPPPSPPSPPPSGPICQRDFDCAGGNGRCLSNGTCACKPGWVGAICGVMNFQPFSGRRAYPTPLWTWGGSPILDTVTGIYHLFSSEMSNNCGILHYCVNSRVIHLTAPNATGPFARREVVLDRRPDSWDNGAIHGISVHRLPNGTYALLYMGSMQPGLVHQPNCTSGSGDKQANATLGDHSGRRIGIATSESLNGPWQRLSAPLFGPDPKAWDNIDVSNPSPIIKRDGSVVMLYKGRGSRMQHMGLAFADSIDGPYRRNASGNSAPDLPGEDPWGWIDNETGIFHAVFHDGEPDTSSWNTHGLISAARVVGNGATSAGSHRWSEDGIVWYGDGTPPAYTGEVQWAEDPANPTHSGKTTVLGRRERPQILLTGTPGSSYGQPSVLFSSAQDCAISHSDGGTGIPCPNGIGTDLTYTILEEIAH